MTKALIIIAIVESIGVTIAIFNTFMSLYFTKKDIRQREAQCKYFTLEKEIETMKYKEENLLSKLEQKETNIKILQAENEKLRSTLPEKK